MKMILRKVQTEKRHGSMSGRSSDGGLEEAELPGFSHLTMALALERMTTAQERRRCGPQMTKHRSVIRVMCQP